MFKIAANAYRILNDLPTVPLVKTLTRNYAAAMMKSGPDSAFSVLLSLSADSLHYHVSEDELNDLGLQWLYASTQPKHNEWALAVLQLNILLYPDSFNTYDSYGEALAHTGHKQDALFMYRRSLQLNPKNENAVRVIRELTQ